MPRVTFTDNLKRHLAVPRAEVPAGTVRTALEAVFEDRPQLRSYLLDDQGRLRKHVNVFVDGAMVADRDGLTDAVGDSAEIYVFQALSGG